tara:strand:+ start:1296 stop:1802 length:507 start_codon:yes stop_codon:yes gene_type:complete
MNLLALGIIIFIFIYLILNWFAKTSTKKIAQFLKRLAIIISVFLAAILTIGGKYIFSLPFLLILLSGLKIKGGLTLLQLINLYRLIQVLKSLGRFGNKGSQATTSLSIEESYKILGLKKGCSKEDVLKAAVKLQKKIHPDMNRGDVDTERLSQLVNEAKEKIIKTDFS